MASAVALAFIAPPVLGAADYAANNARFFLTYAGFDAPPAGTFHLTIGGDDRVLTGAELFALAGELTRDVDLQAVAETATAGVATAGDLYLYGGPCDVEEYGDYDPTTVQLTDQTAVRDGWPALTAQCGFIATVNHSLKSMDVFGDATAVAHGWFISFFFFWLGFGDAVVTSGSVA